MGNTDEKGYSPQVVSIFSGCGGLDLGFHLEGYETIWANDFAEWAVKSFEKNFGKCEQIVIGSSNFRLIRQQTSRKGGILWENRL